MKHLPLSTKTPSVRKKAPIAKKKTASRTRSVWTRTWHTFFAVLDVIVGAVMIFSGYAGNISPLSEGGLYGVVALSFPIWMAASFLLLAVQLFIYRRGAAVTGAFMLACAGPLLTNCPLNIRFFKPDAPEGWRSFTLMTYNCSNLNFWKQPGHIVGDTLAPNPIVDDIIRHKPDVVALQELHALKQDVSLNITAAQIDSIRRIYPHIVCSGKALVLLSRFPVEPIHLDFTPHGVGGDMSAYAISVYGRRVALFNVHLQSIGLSHADKSLYTDLTSLKTSEGLRSDLHGVKSQLLSKLSAANVARARECRQLLRYLSYYGGPDAIVCGDFNDGPGCYSIRELEGFRMKSVYPEIGFGPMITFNDNRFYFCIDHVLYRGDMKPLDITKGRMKWSDHYPLTVKFAIKPGA